MTARPKLQDLLAHFGGGLPPDGGGQVGQRWEKRRDLYKVKPAEERIDPSRYEVEPMQEGPAKAFVVEHHYSGSYPAARLPVGLFEHRPVLGRRLVGVAVFSQPMQGKAIPRYAPGLTQTEGVELGRLVLTDDVPFYGETFFLARAFKVLAVEKPDVRFVLSYSDPLPRTSEDGAMVMPGHIGAIYQAFNGTYFGRGSPRKLWLDHAGRVLSERMLGKIRTEDSRMGYGVRTLIAAGAPPRRAHESWRDWVDRALHEGPFREVRHPGNHAYGWAIGRGRRRLALAEPRPYPKKKDA